MQKHYEELEELTGFITRYSLHAKASLIGMQNTDTSVIETLWREAESHIDE
jgi:heme-degrading monooxygenase HmoA